MTEEEYLKLVGDRIRNLRKPLLTQEELADKLGTKHTQIGRIERGEANCTLSTLKKIAFELGLTVSELIDINEPQSKKKKK